MKKFIYILTLVASVCLISCQKEEPMNVVRVSLTSVVPIQPNQAIITGTIECEGAIVGNTPIMYGFTIGRESTPTVYRNSSGYSDDTIKYRIDTIMPDTVRWPLKQEFTMIANSLDGGTIYYVRAMVMTTSARSVVYSNEMTVKTLGEEKSVDLGLSVKWASMNIGASRPEMRGDYFAWGETSPKNKYSADTYKWSGTAWTSITKYTYPDGRREGAWYSGYTFIGDNKTTLDLEDDAAHVNWGGNWRMPTMDEMYELCNKCTWTWTDNYNETKVAGYIVSSKTNSNSIFLPASGKHESTGIRYLGSEGWYWSSSLGSGLFGSTDANFLHLTSSNAEWANYRCERTFGLSIRPVCP